MTRTRRVIETLGLFTEFQARLTATEIAERMGMGRATAYRCIADLEAGGLLESAGNGQYVLGPAIVQLDRVIRQSDPLIRAAEPVMRPLASRLGGSVLLCRVHGNKVLCVHDEAGPDAPALVSYQRGRAMPLYHGATSRAILCHLSTAQLAQLCRSDADGLRRAGLPAEVDMLEQHLAPQRERDVWHSVGEVDPGVAGWAVALHQGRQLLGSLSVVMAVDRIGVRGGTIAEALRRAGLRIEGRLSG